MLDPNGWGRKRSELISLRKLSISFTNTALVLVSVAMVALSDALAVAKFAIASRA